jgi:hypothetical protein
MPGAMVKSFNGISPVIGDFQDYYSYRIYEFSVDLPEEVDLQNGWISIYVDYAASGYNWFFWWGSDEGDMSAIQWLYYAGYTWLYDDMSLALTGKPFIPKMTNPQWPDETAGMFDQTSRLQ